MLADTNAYDCQQPVVNARKNIITRQDHASDYLPNSPMKNPYATQTV